MPPWDKYQGNAAVSEAPPPAQTGGNDAGPWQHYDAASPLRTPGLGNTAVEFDPVTQARKIVPLAAESIEKRASAFGAKLAHAQGKLPNADYSTGTDWNDRMVMSMMDTDPERQNYLQQRYGENSVFQDQGGRFLILKNGKLVSPTGGGFVGGIAADIAGNAPELMLMGQGAATGAALGGPPGAIIGAMAGAGMGKFVQETEKAVAGLERKTPAELRRTMTETFAGGAAAEAVSRPVAGLVKRAMKGGVPDWISGATSESKSLTAQSLRLGGTPPIRSALPHLKATQFHQALGEKVAGDLLEKHNLAAVQGEMTRVLQSAGMNAKDIPEAMRVIMNPSAAPSSAEAGKELGDYAKQYQQMIVDFAELQGKGAQQQLDKNLGQVRAQMRVLRAGNPNVAGNVAEAIMTARKDFGTAAERLYQQVDKLVGDRGIVPTFLPKERAGKMLGKMPESDIKPIVKEIAEWQPLETFENMQRMRTRLRELGDPSNLAAAGLTKRDLRQLRDLVDASFDRAILGEAPRATTALRVADGFYREGIKKFTDTSINNLVASIQTGIYPDAQTIIKTVFQRGQSSRASQIMQMLPDPLKSQIRGEYGKDLLERATDPNTKEISGSTLNRIVSGRNGEGPLLDIAFGTKSATEIRAFAQRLAARDEKVPIEMLSGDRIGESIQAAQKAQVAVERFLDDNYLSELAKPSLAPEMVYKHLVRAGHESELERAVSFFGEGSPQIQKLRETALVDLMHRAVTTVESGAGKTIGADALDSALSGLSEKQQRLLFPDGLSDDLRTVAQVAKFLFPNKEGDMAAGLAAGVIKSALPFGAVGGAFGGHSGHVLAGTAIGAYAYAAFWNYVLSRPTTIRYLALGLNDPGPARQVAIETLRNTLRAGVMGMLPSPEDSKQ